MNEVAMTRSSNLARVTTWTLLAVIPALAIVALGAGAFSGSMTSASAPETASVDDTRDFARQGDDLAALTGASEDSALNQWQNTVRRRPSPRR